MNCWNCCNVWVSRSNFHGNYPERNVGKALLQRLGVNVKSSMAVWLRLNFEFKFLTLGSSCPGYDLVCCKDSLPEMFLPQPQVRTHGFLEQRWAACGTDQLAWRSSSCSSTSDSDCHLVKAALYRWLIIDLDDFRWLFLQRMKHHSTNFSQFGTQCFIILGCLPQLLIRFIKQLQLQGTSRAAWHLHQWTDVKRTKFAKGLGPWRLVMKFSSLPAVA